MPKRPCRWVVAHYNGRVAAGSWRVGVDSKPCIQIHLLKLYWSLIPKPEPLSYTCDIKSYMSMYTEILHYFCAGGCYVHQCHITVLIATLNLSILVLFLQLLL